MPHSNDKTVVTAAGDHEVRVFDLEYAGKYKDASNASSAAAARQTRGFGSHGLEQVYQGVRYLSDGNTNARVYRSHSDRVKRIVTESSPYLFLTCSEDGEVRQFDTRLPSSAYPAARGGRGFRLHSGDHDDSNVPPPLISYKRYRLDLNTISCSPSQPHYIVLGGAHLHCFLHDRRMVGRDIQAEKGKPGLSPTSADGPASDDADDLMGEATRCVRRFAPKGKKKMGRTENGHVTAAKISDAHPNEMIASWSGDHIYSFDLVRSSDARDGASKSSPTIAEKGKKRIKESWDRKRKRKQGDSSGSSEGLQPGVAQPARPTTQTSPEDVVLRVRYENGQSEDISIEPTVGERVIEQSRDSVLNESQKRSVRIAKSVVKIRKLLFSLEATARDDGHDDRLSAHGASFTGVLGSAAALLPEMDDIIRSWPYPVRPSPEEVAFHNTLRHYRDSGRRFVQACGTLARVLGGKLQTASAAPSPALALFDVIKPSELEGNLKEPGEAFRHNFLKAILLWLEGGRKALLEGFMSKASVSGRFAAIFPIPDDSDDNGIEEHLVPTLIQMASASLGHGKPAVPITNVDASRFETDETRLLFLTEMTALRAFSEAIKIPLRDLSQASKSFIIEANGSGDPNRKVQAQDRQVALRYWGFKVCRGLLLNAGEGVDFAMIDRAYGGLGIPREVDEGRAQENINLDTEEAAVTAAKVVRPGASKTDRDSDLNGQNTSEEVEGNQADLANGEDSEDDMGDEDSEEEDDDNEEDDEEGEDDGGLANQFLFRPSSERYRLRSQVQNKIPVSTHSREYRGHCNVKTVKDVNFFGLEDEYVVSGCDSGHLFIWDRKSSRLLNILKGDGEVVNVIQGTVSPSCLLTVADYCAGHPYEPLLAVSGIDHTIKIFSPDQRAQRDAQLGRNLNIDPSKSSNSSSIHWGLRRRRRRPNVEQGEANGAEANAPPPASDDEDLVPDEDELESQAATHEVGNKGLSSRKRMHDSYKIISQNDIDRVGGNNEAYITVSGPSFPLRLMAVSFAEWMDMVREAEGVGGN